METKLEKTFQAAKYESDINLPEDIWHSITLHSHRMSKIKLWIFSLVGLLSLAGLIPAVRMLSSDFAQSGFYEYFSLIFSGGGSILSFWKELALSLAESLPAMSIVATLTLIFIFFLSMRYLMKQFNRNQLILIN